ncbi:DUF4129 domain-containing protein [Mycobacterium sp. 236(2023)]|uniref:DUF4129 domain-containing protein n=1 Tax=Mycobacterium sp. 236(2023) TaxID=3038163 RepID=UPI0024153BE2|nr:DUF4129 domain-containing protein [Mycobacterium sp. 236(2023)]MDG4662997.1 DUF4129 domain-containing protein [Mycobacterium sp. 236(2023)]
MRGDDRAIGRTIAVIVLMALATVALRGYLPGAERRDQPEELTASSGSVVPVIVMLVASIAVIAVAILSQALQRSAGPGAGDPQRRLGGPRTPLRWRPLVIAIVVLLVWSLVLVLLMRWVSPEIPDNAAPADPGAPPAQSSSEGDQTPPARPSGGGAVFVILAVATTVLVAMSIAGTVLRRRRTPAPTMAPASRDPAPPPAAAPDLVRAAELGLAAMDDPGRDPREAIIACYLAMERELEKSPGTTPRDSDTPSEVLARAIELHALEAGSATELVVLFEEARFSPHVMNESHRADAVRALRAVLDELRVAP